MKTSRVLMVTICLLVAAIVLLGAVAFSADSAASAPAFETVDVWGLATAVDPGGQVWAVWAADDGRDAELFYSRWDGREWAPAQLVHASPDAWESGPSLAFAPGGTPWLAWTSATSQTSDVYLSRWLGSRWSDPQAMPKGSALEADEPALAVAPDGTLWLAWVGFDGVDDEIYVTRWDGRAWSPAWQVSADDDEQALYDRQPRLAAGPDGTLWLVWTGHQDGVDDEIYYSRWTGTRWTPEALVSTDDDALDVGPALAFDAGGRPWVAWKAQVDDGSEPRLRILVSHWDTARAAWTPEALASSPLASDVDETLPALALAGDGRLHLAWRATTPDGEEALVEQSWTGTQWLGARVVRAGVSTHALRLVPGDGDAVRLVWPQVPAGGALPLDSEAAAEPLPLLEEWIPEQAIQSEITVDPISNRFLAFGDSITWGLYPVDNPEQPPFYPYPSTLEDTLDVRVMASEVINAGVSGEGTGNGKDRIKEEVADYRPQYVMIMEGTNNVSHDAVPSEILSDYLIMIDNARKHAGVDHVKVMLATLIPRLDSRNDETWEMNQQAVLPAAADKGIPVCDQWTAFYDYIAAQGIPLETIYWDSKHPNQEGLDLFAATWYDCLLSAYSWLTEEGDPPVTWIDSLPAESMVGAVTVNWTGSDNLSWVVDYDVQVSVNGGPWTDWRMATTATSADYVGAQHGDELGFRVRGRDVVGNQSDWSAAAYTTVVDNVPPEAFFGTLYPYDLSPISLNWWATDVGSGVAAYWVEYRVGLAGTWTAISGLNPTGSTGADFVPSSPQYGQTYYFRVKAQDVAGNWGLPSNEASTTLAQFSLQGSVYNPRHQPVFRATVGLDPAALHLAHQPAGSFLAYLVAGGDYDVSVSRPDRYGPLPDMYDVAVSADVSGLSFVLPSPDDAVVDGGFEAGDLDAWQLDGTTTLTTTAHTGLGAVRLGGVGETASLGQPVTPSAGEWPTLSFFVRLEQPGTPGVLQIELANTGVLSPPVTYTLPVDGEAWTHVWYDLTGLVSEPLTLTFRVSDTAPILLDEVSLGASPQGLYQSYMPCISRN